MTIKRRKKIALWIIALLLAPAIPVAGVLALAQSPRAVNHIAAFIQPLTGVFLRVDDVSLKRNLELHLKGLRMRTIAEDGFDVSVSRATVQGGLGPGLDLKIEKILLTAPEFTFQIGGDGPEADPFALLRRMPPVRLLKVQDGRLTLKSPSAVYTMPGMNMTIRDFDPEGGGKLDANLRFHFADGDSAARGALSATLDMTAFSPGPAGAGSLRAVLATGVRGDLQVDDVTLETGFALDGHIFSFTGTRAAVGGLAWRRGADTTTLKGLKARLNGSFNGKTSGFTLASLDMSGAGIGSLTGRVSGTLAPPGWNLSLQAASLDLAEVLALAGPLLPEPYGEWTFKGKGRVAVESQGRHLDGATVWQARAVVDLDGGGFASPDSSKAGERITGKIELNLGSPDKASQGRFNAAMSCDDGEVLWGPYYQDFHGESVKVVSRGAFTQNPFSLSSSGTFDLFQTGDYTFSTNLSPGQTRFSLDGANISCPRLFAVLLRNHVEQHYPDLRDLTWEGESDLKLALSISPREKRLEGHFTLRDGALRSPLNDLLLTGLNISLPYDLALGDSVKPHPPDLERKGSLSFDAFQKNTLRISRFGTPVILSGNRMIMPDPIDLPLFGGHVRLAGLRVENLLLPDTRADTGVTIRELPMEALSGPGSPIPLAGIIDGDLPAVSYRHGEWRATGKVIARIFGGRITVENLFGGRLFAPSRFFGADVTLDQIDLEEVTATIRLGRMTGLIKGTLSGFTMEYGQPSRFDLVMQTDRSRKVPQKISVDAINSLSIISTGSGAMSAILSGGVNRFFKSYPYREIGFRCTLADDVFTLRGLIHQGGTEYLVRRSPFRGIDIINQNPDNSISFKDMSERVGRLFHTRPDTEEEMS
ncbi:MAG: hypothetical protein WCX84_07395 [Syntrophales bacterium]|jgi:hypothetical protein|nr:hypothetical protein [Syntrophales bacterium]